MRRLPELEPDAIRAAVAAIDPVFRNSPQYVHDGLSERLGVPVIVKVESRVDEMRLVDDEALRAAQAELTDALGITVEGAAAASWAGLLAGPRPDGPAVVIVTGSNV